MNKAILIGNLASDPDFRTLQSGIAYCTFRLAVQRRFANAEGKREADFINIVCWRQTAELAQKFLRKGSRAAVEGAIQNRSYDAQDGTKRYVTEVIADSIEFLTPRSADPGPTPPPERGYAGGMTTPPSASQTPPLTRGGKDDGYARQMDFVEVSDDELPF